MMRRLRGLLAALLSSAAPIVTAEVSRDIDPDTGLERWQFRRGALDLELVQRLPDQTRAFFMGRGFDVDSADRFARACVFQAIVRNVTPADATAPALRIDLADWRAEHAGVVSALPLEPQWQQAWQDAGQTQGARVAFRWALFPTRQVFQPGDNNWGMIALGPTPGSELSVDLAWQEDGRPMRGRIMAVQCPRDTTINDRLGDER